MAPWAAAKDRKQDTAEPPRPLRMGEWVEAELRPTMRLMSSECTRASGNLGLPMSRPTAAHLLNLLQSVKTVTGEQRILCLVCGRDCAVTLCTENSLASLVCYTVSKYLTHLSIQAARYLNNVNERPNGCPRCGLKRLLRKMCPPTFKEKSNFWISFIPVVKPDYRQMELYLSSKPLNI